MNLEDLAKPVPRDEHLKTVDKLEEAKRALYVTLLDQFAMAALTGLCASIGIVTGQAPTDEDLARYAYEAAEAMMNERDNHKQI